MFGARRFSQTTTVNKKTSRCQRQLSKLGYKFWCVPVDCINEDVARWRHCDVQCAITAGSVNQTACTAEKESKYISFWWKGTWSTHDQRLTYMIIAWGQANRCVRRHRLNNMSRKFICLCPTVKTNDFCLSIVTSFSWKLLCWTSFYKARVCNLLSLHMT